MKNIHLSVAISDYDHVRDFVTGYVEAEGIDITHLNLSEQYDAIVASDIFYLVPPDMYARIIEDISKALVEGGIFILKEMDRRPLWKYWINYLQETIMVKLIHFTRGVNIFFMDSKFCEPLFIKNGLTFEKKAVHLSYCYPHIYYIGRKIK